MASNPLDRPPPPHHHVPTTTSQHFSMTPDSHGMPTMAGMAQMPAPDGYGFVAPPPPPPPHAPLSPTNSRKRRASDVDTSPGQPMTMQAMPPPASAVPYGDHDPFSAMQQSVATVNNPDGSTGPPNTPMVKKSRTNTPWTPAEEHRLKLMRDAGNSWSEIAKTFPNRTEGSVKKHWYKDMHYAEFAEDESAALLAAIKEYEASKWKVIGQKLGKPAKACEQYAKEHFGGKI